MYIKHVCFCSLKDLEIPSFEQKKICMRLSLKFADYLHEGIFNLDMNLKYQQRIKVLKREGE